MKFEATRTSYLIEIEHAKFLDLIDSESYVTENAAFQSGNQTLCDKLKSTPAMDVEYNGHFGAAVYLTLECGDDTDESRAAILTVIEEHLAWCATPPKRESVVARRAAAIRSLINTTPAVEGGE